MAEGGVAHRLALCELVLSKGRKIVVLGGEEAVVLRGVGLNDDLSGAVGAAGAAGDLGEKLEGALGGAEVREVEAHVREHDADQRDVGEVVAFGDHLGADEDVDLASTKAAQKLLEARAAAGVAVEAGDAGAAVGA